MQAMEDVFAMRPVLCRYAEAPQHFLYFLPLPQGQGSLRPTLGSGRW